MKDPADAAGAEEGDDTIGAETPDAGEPPAPETPSA